MTQRNFGKGKNSFSGDNISQAEYGEWEEETHDGISGKIKNREAAKLRGSQKDKPGNESGVSEM